MVEVVELRRWLALLRRPDRLDSPEIVELLRRHGRLPDGSSRLAVGQAAAQLLRDAIDRLRAPDVASRQQQLPYLVLRTCFLDGAKLFQAAAKLGVSERQLSRERAWAIELLREELESLPAPAAAEPAPEPAPYRPEPVPAIEGYLARLSVSQELLDLLRTNPVVFVTGPPGIGKTCLVANVVAAVVSGGSVLWYRVRPSVNDSLAALLYDVAEFRRSQGDPTLADYFAGALPSPDLALAARLALHSLASSNHLLVLDDFHVVEKDPAICGFLEEAVARTPGLRIVAISRHGEGPALRGATFAVPPMARFEVGKLLDQLGVRCAPDVLETLREWTNGVPQLVTLAAACLKAPVAGTVADEVMNLGSRTQVQEYLLGTLTELLAPDDRAMLDAASVFRDRFSDDALATVSRRTRGAVKDAAQRLVRAHVATRSLDGECAFFHASVRDYVYERIPAARRRALHRRAAEWYERAGVPVEAAYHRAQAAGR